MSLLISRPRVHWQLQLDAGLAMRRRWVADSMAHCPVNSCSSPGAGLYCPVPLSVATSCACTCTTAAFCDLKGRPGSVTSGGWATTVTADPGRHALLAAAVKYSRATAWSLVKLALVRRKPLTICCGPQSGCGAFMIMPQQLRPLSVPLPGPGGMVADTTPPLTGTAAQPAAKTASTAPAAAHGMGRR